MEIKDIIRNKRLERGYTMKQLADKVGVSEATVSRWESGHLSTMKHTKIALLSEALGISPVLLFSPSSNTSIAQHLPYPQHTNELQLEAREKTVIKKYRQLDADGKEDVDDYMDMKLAKLQRKAEENEAALG